MRKLKPCPLCGGDSEFYSLGRTKFGFAASAECLHCGVRVFATSQSFDPKTQGKANDMAVEMWNWGKRGGETK